MLHASVPHLDGPPSGPGTGPGDTDPDLTIVREAGPAEIELLFAGYRPLVVRVQGGWVPSTDTEWTRVRTVSNLLQHPPAPRWEPQGADDSPPDEPCDHATSLGINESIISIAATNVVRARQRVAADLRPPEPVYVYDVPEDSPHYDPFLAPPSPPRLSVRLPRSRSDEDDGEDVEMDARERLLTIHRRELDAAEQKWTRVLRDYAWIAWRLGYRDRPVSSGDASLMTASPAEKVKSERGLREKFPRAWESWRNGKQRCRNPKNPRYADYAARGITWPEYWNAFPDFVADTCQYTGPGTGKDCPRGKTLERPDNDRPYARGNWKWETKKKQAQNRRPPHPNGG